MTSWHDDPWSTGGPGAGAPERPDPLPPWCWIGIVAAIEGVLCRPLVSALASDTAGAVVLCVALAVALLLSFVVRRRGARLTGPGRWIFLLVGVLGGALVAALVRHGAPGGAALVLVATVPLLALAVARMRRDLLRAPS